jgi:hypothetical protein
MRPLKLCAALLLPLCLCGCLEAEQHPRWVHGEYAGKADNLPFQVAFHNDRLAWFAAIQDRNLKQNEYNRANP